jgi:hypothetical protein
MTNLEIKFRLEQILAKISDNQHSAWNADLESYSEAIAIEDHFGDADSDEPDVVYNGWLDELEALYNDIIA